MLFVRESVIMGNFIHWCFRKIAWSTPPEPTKQISANIISIDGGIFSKQINPEESNVQSIYKTQPIPAQYERYGIGKRYVW